jgi:aminoglycoside phosphotransferase (APT) family kinase protein
MSTELQNKLEKYLTKHFGTHTLITSMVSLSGGACQDNYLIDIQVNEKEEHRFVFRTDKGASLLFSLDRVNEYKVADLAYRNGVKTPKSFFLEEDKTIIGSPFYFMERIQGKATGRYVVKDPSLNKIRTQFTKEIAESLSKIHSITIDKIQDLELLKVLTQFEDSVGSSAIKSMREQVNILIDPHPAMELILNWLEKNIPQTEKPVLVHGDFRTGNFMVNESGLQGIVDWEFAHLGDPHEDIAWLCMRDWRFGKVNKEAGGFATREEFYSEYEIFSKTKIDPKKVLFWEVMGNLRWAVGSAGQAERHISGKDKGIELASIGRRTCEMELEAMRLIENAR